MTTPSAAGIPHPSIPHPSIPHHAGQPHGGRPDSPVPSPGVLKAMSPGVVDFLFRQLVAGEPGEDIQWGREGTTLSAQPVGAELARRLAETDLDALTPLELFHYVRAAQRLASWAESLREDAVRRYCGPPDPGQEPSRPRSRGTENEGSGSRGMRMEFGDPSRRDRA